MTSDDLASNEWASSNWAGNDWAGNDWESTAIALFTEIEILGSIIHERIEAQRPAGLGEADLSVLMLVAKSGGIGTSLATLVWTLESSFDNPEAIARALIEQGLLTFVGESDAQTLTLTDKGKKTIAVAMQELLPNFAPALQDIPNEALHQALHTIREIRRTLDHLP